jgi:hypothetical protein
MKLRNSAFLFVLATVFAFSGGSLGFAQGACLVTTDPGFEESFFEASPAEPGGSFPVNSAPPCWWRPTEILDETSTPVGWITITTYGWSVGEGLVNFVVADNSGPARQATIYIEGILIHTVFQAGNCEVDVATGPGAADSVFVTSPSCERLVEISSGFTLIDPEPQTASRYEGVEYGPDGKLYVSDSLRGLYRIDPSTGLETQVFPASGAFIPKNARFTHDGDLVVANGAPGLFKFENLNSVGDSSVTLVPATIPVIANSAGFGPFTDVTTAANGDLLGTTAAGLIKRFPFVPGTGSYGNADLTITTEEPAIPRGITRAANGTVMVANGSSVWAYPATESPSVCAAFVGDVVGIDSAADDTLYVTVVNDDNVGELWEISYGYPAWTCVTPSAPIATFTGSDTTEPVYGVAVPFSSRGAKLLDATTMEEFNIPVGVQAFNFFDSLYEFLPPPADSDCTVNLWAHEFSPSFIQNLIDTEGIAASNPITFWGDNGRAIGYQYEDTGATCDPDGSILYKHAINAFYLGYNPQIMRCTDPEAANPGCELISFQSYYPGFGFFPDDGRMGGTTPAFSHAFLVNATAEDTDYAGEFCGFQSPLDWPTNVDDNNLPVFNGGSDMPVKFTVANTAAGGNCDSGPFVTKTIIAVLSVARVDPDFDAIDDLDLTGGGSFEDNRIVFSNPRNKNKPFALQVKLSEDGNNLPPGTYQIVVTDDTANTNGTSTYYFPTQTTYFRVK